MPRILESEALALTQSIDTLSDEQKPQALDILTRYKAQQEDDGEPQWPTHARTQEEGEQRFRAMFDDLANVDKAAPSLVETLQYSENPDADRARVANIAYLSRIYDKPADEIGGALDLYKNDFTTKRGKKGGLDDLAFYGLAKGEVATMKKAEETRLEGAKAALRGEDVIGSLQAWQAKNLDNIPGSTEFTKGYLKAKETAGDVLPIADELLKSLEGGFFKTTGDGKNRPETEGRETAARRNELVAELATMKPRERKQVYASIAARVEAAGYDQKGFWAQMLGQLGRGIERMGSTVGTMAGGALDVMKKFPAMLSDTMKPEEFAATDASIAQRQALGEIHDEIASIVSGTVDPVKPTIGWLNDTIETGLIKGPGTVAPFMAATAALGPWGGGMLFTADFAEQNRRDLRAAGLDNDRAVQIGTIAAPLQAAVESLSNMLQLGKFTKLQTVLAGLTRPIGGGAGLALRYAQNAGISLATEFTEEQIQDNFIVPAVQQIVGALASDVPEVDWSFYRTRAAESTPELLSVLAPMALVFGGMMTGAQANLSREMTGNIDALKALNYSEAQAVEIVAEKSEEARIAKASSLWGARAGDKTTLEEGAKNLSERMRQLSGDVMAQQQELERRGILPRMLRATEDQWRLTFQDGSTAAFNSHAEADAARWTWTEDQLGKVHALTRETLSSLEKNLDVNREVGVEFSPDIRTAQDAVNDGASVEQIKQRVEQGKTLGDVSPDAAFDDAQAIDKATAETDGFLSSLQILGSSKNEFKDGVLRTTIKLWEGSNVLTLVEEKLEGDAKAIIADERGRDWMVARLRSYEQASGDKLFRDVEDGQLKDDDIIEAWSHLGQSYLVGRSTFGEPLQKRAMRRFGKLLMRSGFTGAMNSEAAFFQAVANRAQKLGELKSAGKLSDDLVSELEKQLGIDSQVAHDQGAEAEAKSIIDTSGYSEETPGPNGETFSISSKELRVKIEVSPDSTTLGNLGITEGFHANHGGEVVPDFAPRASKQGRKGQYAGFYLGPAINEVSQYGQNVSTFPLNPNTPVKVLRRPGQVERITPEMAAAWRAEGFSVVVGPAIIPSKIEIATLSANVLNTPGPNGETFSTRAVPADASKVVQMPDGAQLVGPTTFSIRAYHGTPHKVDKFTTAKIGTGEGAQAYGWGLYFAEEKQVAEGYQSRIAGAQWVDKAGRSRSALEIGEAVYEQARKDGYSVKDADELRSYWSAYAQNGGMQNTQGIESIRAVVDGQGIKLKRLGNLYTVELLPDADEFLDWDKPLNEQSEKVKAALKDALDNKVNSEVDYRKQSELARRYGNRGYMYGFDKNNGSDIYQELDDSPMLSSKALAAAGIPGIRYLDGNSRDGGKGTSNYVIFNESLVRILEENGKPVETFSLRSGDFASRMAAAFSPFQANPEARRAMGKIAHDRVMRIGADWIEKAARIRSGASIGSEQRFREADGFDRRITAYLDSLTPNARQTLEFEPSSLESDPLIAAMLDFGKLMSRSTAVKNGVQNLDEYEGQPWLPPAWYSKGSGITPGKMAKAMHEGVDGNGGPLTAGDSAADLWGAIASRIESTRKDKAAHAEAVQAYKEAQKAAKVDARLEAEAWANQQKQEAGSPKAQREMLKAALRTLDGLLSAAPPEVRSRVGGYVKLAGLATDEAMLKEIERRIAKLDEELSKWLKKDGISAIEKLFKKAAADFTAGKKAKGKIGPDEHHLFQRAKAASEMDAATLTGELARLDALIDGDTLTPEQEALAILERGILELVGNLKEADAGRVHSALDELNDIYTRGRMEWKLKIIAKREARAALREELRADTGKSGVKKERQAMDAVSQTLLGKSKSLALSLSSFHEVLTRAFGSKSKQAMALVDDERNDSNDYEDEQQALADEVEELYSSMAGGKVLDGEKLRFDMAQPSIDAGTEILSQHQAIQALLIWRQDDGKRHMEGTRDENGQVTSSWSYDQAWIDNVTSKLTPEARRVMAWIMSKYGSEHAELNALYRERHGVNMPKHDNYAPVTVKPVQTKAGEMVDPVSGAAMTGSILTPGSLRTRSRNAIAEPDFRDALQTLIGHKKQMGYWKAYYDLAVEAQAVLGNREVMNSVHAAAGEETVKMLRRWVDVLSMGGTRDAAAGLALTEGMRRITNRAATVGLLGRVSTLLVQSTQLAAASVKMPVGAYLKRFSKLITGNLAWGDAVNSPFIQRRIQSAPPIVRQAMESLGVATRPNQITRSTRWLGQLLSGADGLFTGGTYAILLDYHRETGAKLGLSGAELESHAHTEAERATEQVAQPTRTAARSMAEITATNPLAKVGWAYASEARQKLALAAWAASNAKAEPVQAAKVAFLVFVVGGLMSQVLKNLWKEAKGDDDERKWSPERLVMSMLSGPLHGIPLASELSGDGGMLSGFVWAGPAIKDIAEGEGDMRDVDTLLSAAGYFNDTAAGVAALSHAGLDFAKVLGNLFDE